MLSNEEKKYILRSALADVKRNLRLLLKEKKRCESLDINTPISLHIQIATYAGRLFRLREVFREEML